MRSNATNLALPAKPLTQDPKLYIELVIVYNAIRLLAQAFDDIVNEVILTAFEGINAGQLVAVYNDAGTGKLRKALDPTYFCIGWAGNTVSAGQSCRCIIRHRFPELPGGTLTPAAKYYLSAAVAGAITLTPGNQLVGIAQSDTTLLWKPQL